MFGLDLLLQAGWCYHWKTMWKMWWQVCDPWLLYAHTWWVWLWLLSGCCAACGGPGVSDAYYCKECAIQKDRDGCPKTVHLGSSKTNLFYDGKNMAPRRGNWQAASSLSTCCQQEGVEHRASSERPISPLAPFHPSLSPRPDNVVGMERIPHRALWQTVREKMTDSFMVFLEFEKQDSFSHW